MKTQMIVVTNPLTKPEVFLASGFNAAWRLFLELQEEFNILRQDQVTDKLHAYQCLERGGRIKPYGRSNDVPALSIVTVKS